MSEVFKIRGSLETPANRAIGFYAIVAATTIGGAALLLTDIDPIAMLFWTAVINGVVAVPIMAATMMVVSGKHHSGLALPRWVIILGWLATAPMAIVVILLIWSSPRAHDPVRQVSTILSDQPKVSAVRAPCGRPR